MRRVRAPPDAPVDAEHSTIGIHQGQGIELKPGCAREHGQHAEHPSRLVGDRRRHSKHAEPVGPREQPITLPQRIPADGFEDELDRRSAWACPRFKVHGPVVDHVINEGPAFEIQICRMATHSAWEQLIACAQCVNRTYISGRHGRPAAMTVCQKSAARKATTIMRRIRPRVSRPRASAGRDRSCETTRLPASEPTSQILITFRFFQESAAKSCL